MKRYGLPTAAILLVMLLLPWLTVRFVPGDAGMAACFALFYAVNPLLAAGLGVLAALRRQWWWPLAVAAAFMAGVWLVFAPGEMAFLLYAGAYLALGLAVMGVTRLALKMKER